MNKEFLKNHVARGVLIITDTHGSKTIDQVPFTRRPWWSKVGETDFALPGGKIIAEDFEPLIAEGFLTQAQYDDPNFEPSEELMQRAAAEAVKREFLEELGPEAAALLAVGLIYIGRYENYDATNNTTWVSHVLGTRADHKPPLLAQPDADGVIWENAPNILDDTVSLKTLPGHVEMAADAIRKIKPKQE